VAVIGGAEVALEEDRAEAAVSEASGEETLVAAAQVATGERSR
jgi:hypothetical protein